MNPDGSQDNNLVTLGSRESGIQGSPNVIIFPELIAQAYHTAALKITDDCHDIHVFVKKGRGGKENWCDCNNEARRIEVHCDELEAPGKYAFTAKGGCEDILFKANLVGQQPKICHVDLGSWSDQCKRVTSNIKLWLKTSAPVPITWRTLHATNPVLMPGTGPYKCKFKVPGGANGRAILMFFWDIGKRLNWN